MKELIKISETENGELVNARDLHSFLEVKTKFNLWIKRTLERYGFEDGSDYTAFKTEQFHNQSVRTDYALTLDCAKQISMTERTEKGKEARKYFIKCEKRAKALEGLTPEEREGLNRENQVNGTHSVKKYLIERFGKAQGIKKFIEWSKYSHKTITGRTTKQTKSLAKKMGLKSAQRASAKEACRHMNPAHGFGHYIADLAAQISGDAKLSAGMGKEAAKHLENKNLPIRTVSKEVVPFS